MSLTQRVYKYSVHSYGKYDGDRRFYILLGDSNGNVIAYLYYIPDSQPLPNNELRGGRIFMYKHASQAAVDIDILRNEKPVQVVYYSPTRAWIHTAGWEPVGEGE
jgi:hypothetical protein